MRCEQHAARALAFGGALLIATVAVAQPATAPASAPTAAPAAEGKAPPPTPPLKTVTPLKTSPRTVDIKPIKAAAPVSPTQIRISLSDDGQSWIRFILWTQVWLRMIHNNPNTMVGGEEKDVDIDVLIRRARFLAVGQLTSRFQLVTHFGINNQTFRNNAFDADAPKRPNFFIHDAWVQFEVIERHLYIGGGLHYWNGVSRSTNAGTLNMLAIDAPILNWGTINSSDEFARWLGVFIKGKTGGLDYRFAVNRPFARGGTDAPAATVALDANANTWALQGYVQYQLLDEESNLLPYAVGTYLGKKRVLNIGAGFLYQKDALHSLDSAGNLQQHDLFLMGVDVFADIPFGEQASMGALTAYTVFYHYEMGPDKVAIAGIANYAGNPSGNAYPLFGTGEHVYAQVGYLLPKSLGVTLQPYFTAQLSFLEGLEDPSMVFEGGLNWYWVGYHAKLTLHYRARPIFDKNREADGFRSEVLLQGMIFI